MIQPCEPQLGKRGLYPQTSTANTQKIVENMMNVIGYSDGENDCISISDITGVPLQECIDWCRKLTTHGVMEKVS
ncbi:winged helix-turn-helix domain-containing protein [Aeromonas hydrophila]